MDIEQEIDKAHEGLVGAGDHFVARAEMDMREIYLMFDEAEESGDAMKMAEAEAQLKRLEERVRFVGSLVDGLPAGGAL